MIRIVSGDILLSQAHAIGFGVAPNDPFSQGLAQSLRERWPLPAGEPFRQAAWTDAKNLTLARLRAEGLTRFVTTYRQVSLWPAPTLAPVDLQALFDRLATDAPA